MTRHGFLWRAHFYTSAEHPAGERYGGYSKFFRAWTKSGARREAEIHRHQRWIVEVERASLS